jgi:hypothetical protein
VSNYGICRLACAFANSLGGIIVFGVHDSKRTGGHNKVKVNLDLFVQAFHQLTGANLLFDFRSYESENYGAVDILLVKPRKAGDEPLRFIRKLGPYPAGVYWVRTGHEVVSATPTHFPLLFCRASASEQPPERDGSIPPSPATLKRFVGRTEVLDKLFRWLQNSDEPRTYLYGKGGSGKTTIAYEFARLVKDYGDQLLIEGKNHVDVVLFLSAKEKLLVPASGAIESIGEPDFFDEKSLLEQILYFGNWTNSRENISDQGINELREQVQEYFDLTSALIVLDDIDTLMTKGVDPGVDFIYRSLCRSRQKSKVVYTLRNAPTQSLNNSIEVPGLQGTDYDEFVKQCTAHFGVKEPKREFREGRLSEISERRPLVIECIIALVRTALDYDRAAELFAQHAGDNARDYVFSREWDALAGNELARFLLAALGDLNQGATFKDLQTLLQSEESRVLDAIGSVREMFLQLDEAGAEALFSLAPLTKSFVNARKQTLKGYPRLRERVRAFRRTVRISSPAVAAVVAKVQRLMPLRLTVHSLDRVADAWRVVSDPSLPASVTEDPLFKCAYGYTCVHLSPPRLAEAREAFQYAISMRHEPAFGELRTWFEAEKNSGAHDGWCITITDMVINGRSYTELEKTSMVSRKATSIYNRGRDRIYTDQVDAQKDFGEALILHLRAFKLNALRGEAHMDVSEQYARNTARQWFEFAVRGDAPWELLDRVRQIAGQQDIFLDPIHLPFIDYVGRLERTALRTEVANRIRNRIKGVPELLARRDSWLDPTIGRHMEEVVRAFDRHLSERMRAV